MKILAFFGGARKKGNTMAMLDYLLSKMEGEKEIVSCYSLDVSPCIDCKYCYRKRACSIKDGMVDIYRKIDEADIIIYAAPIYFYGNPGPMKVMMDRFQLYWASPLRGDVLFGKKGAIISSGGSPFSEDLFTPLVIEVSEALKVQGAEIVGQELMGGADGVTLDERPEVMEELDRLALLLK